MIENKRSLTRRSGSLLVATVVATLWLGLLATCRASSAAGVIPGKAIQLKETLPSSPELTQDEVPEKERRQIPQVGYNKPPVFLGNEAPGNMSNGNKRDSKLFDDGLIKPTQETLVRMVTSVDALLPSRRDPKMANVDAPRKDEAELEELTNADDQRSKFAPSAKKISRSNGLKENKLEREREAPATHLQGRVTDPQTGRRNRTLPRDRHRISTTTAASVASSRETNSDAKTEKSNAGKSRNRGRTRPHPTDQTSTRTRQTVSRVSANRTRVDVSSKKGISASRARNITKDKAKFGANIETAVGKTTIIKEKSRNRTKTGGRELSRSTIQPSRINVTASIADVKGNERRPVNKSKVKVRTTTSRPLTSLNGRAQKNGTAKFQATKIHMKSAKGKSSIGTTRKLPNEKSSTSVNTIGKVRNQTKLTEKPSTVTPRMTETKSKQSLPKTNEISSKTTKTSTTKQTGKNQSGRLVSGNSTSSGKNRMTSQSTRKTTGGSSSAIVKTKIKTVSGVAVGNRTTTSSIKSSSSVSSSSKKINKAKMKFKTGSKLGSGFQSDASWNRSSETNSNDRLYTQRPDVDDRPLITCEQLKCASGGLCIDGEAGGDARCRCQLGTTGKHCDQEVAVKFPKFDLASYLVIPMFTSIYKEFSVKIQFRPDAPDGLLLYTQDGTNHFIAVSLINGRVEFRFDFGSGSSQIRTKNSVNIGTWNALRLDRTIWNAYVKLNDGSPAKGEPKQFGWTYSKNSYGNYQWNFIVNHTANNAGNNSYGGDSHGAAWKYYTNSLKSNYMSDSIYTTRQPWQGQHVKPRQFHHDFFIGGHSDLWSIENRTGVGTGLRGCVRQVKINDRDYDLRKRSVFSYIGDALYGLDIVECNSAACSNLKCLNGGRCASVGADTSICMCPVGAAGETCQSKVDVKLPAFSGHSFLQYIGLRRSVLLFTDIEVVFRTTHPDALLLFNGYTTDGSPGDFISLAVNNRTVEYRFDLGSGQATLRSVQQVSLNDWHTVRISRYGVSGLMRVDDQPEVKGASSGSFTQLTLALDLFIGGHRNFDEVPRVVQVKAGLKGCIQKVVINEHEFKLIEEAVDGVNIENCSPHPCTLYPSVCHHGGQCIPALDKYQCLCQAGFSNTNCQDKLVRYRYRFF